MLTLKADMREQEQMIKEDAKSIAFGFPNRLFQQSSNSGKVINKGAVISNPIGKLLSTVVKKTLFKKSGFLFKVIGGIFAKKVGKRIEKKMLS